MSADPCNCIDEVNADLAGRGYNAAILTNLFGPKRATVEAYKPDSKKRGKPPIVMASFCPFCGVRYPQKEAKRQAAEQQEAPHG